MDFRGTKSKGKSKLPRIQVPQNLVSIELYFHIIKSPNPKRTIGRLKAEARLQSVGIKDQSFTGAGLGMQPGISHTQQIDEQLSIVQNGQRVNGQNFCRRKKRLISVRSFRRIRQ